MFEDRTYETILAEMLASAPEGVDTRQGSIFYDAMAPHAFKLSKYYQDLELVFDLVFIDSSAGEYLDKKAGEHGLFRLEAVSCKRHFSYVGTTPSSGERFFSGGIYFVLKLNDGVLYAEAEQGGEHPNSLLTGASLIPVSNIIGLDSATLGDVIEPGAEEESDEDLRRRLREKIGGPAENGNKQHYKTWCEEVPGIGRARIFPLWDGRPNTVKGVLLDTEGLPASTTVVEAVQEYIDPGSLGLGEGVANLGAHFTAVTATSINIAVSYTAVLKVGATLQAAKEQTEIALAAYLMDLALNTPEGEDIIIRLTTIGAMIYGLDAILDYSNLLLNGATANIPIDIESVAIPGVVTVA